MIYYDWSRIMRATKGRSKSIVAALESLLPRPKTYKAKAYKLSGIKFTGTSFLLNPEDLIEKAWLWGYTNTANYIGLASLRNTANYIMTGDKTLDIVYSPIPIDRLKENKLLTIKDDKIYFYYEELT